MDSTSTDDPGNQPGLVPCSVCKNEIGTQADVCPKCGSPNTWTHPRIQAMYQTKTFNTPRGFNFWHKGAEVWGQSIYHTPGAYIGAAIILFMALLSGIFSLFIGPVIGGVLLVMFWRRTAKIDTFKANLVANTWESNNPQFWQPVADFLGLSIS